MSSSIALIGDYNDRVIAHVAIPQALKLSQIALGADISWEWIETSAINADLKNLEKFSAIWVVPGSPYLNMDGVLNVIRFARETSRPFLGTCGGFQHALIEYARYVCGVEADHAETNPDSRALVVTQLLCSLVEKTGDISFVPGSQLDSIFRGQPTTEGYHCNYGLNPEWKKYLEAAGLYFTGFDASGDVRAFELPAHPFFIGTLFQPERSGLRGEQHPLVSAFVKAALN